MAIPYAGVHRKLKDADTPWVEKVQLAQYAWVSPRCFLPNREQVLIDWAANSLANANKFSIPDHAVPAVWRFFHDTLQSRRLEKMGSRIDGLSLRPSIFPVLLKSLHKDNVHVELVIGCCHSLLGYPSLGSVITGKFDNQVQFLCTVVKLLTSFLKADDGRTADKLNILVQKAFACFASLQRQQHNPRKVFTVVYEKLLQPVLMLHHAIKTLGDTDEDTYGGVLKCIVDLIANGLFNRDLVEGHTKFLRSAPGQVITDKQKEIRLLHESIGSLWKNMADKVSNKQEDECSTSYVTGMSAVYRAFLNVNKYPRDVSFAMFRKLCCTMGIIPAEHDGKPMTTGDTSRPAGLPHQSEDDTDPDGVTLQPSGEELKQEKCCHRNLKVCLPILSELLNIVAEKQIYEVAADNMEGKLHFRWLGHLVDGLMSNPDSSKPAWYDCLNTLLDMNHLLLEDKLTQILKEALYCLDQTNLENNERLAVSRDNFLEKLLSIYTKLRQFDRVVEVMLEACLIPSTCLILSYPTRFSNSFSESVQSLPPGLTLDIWKQFHKAFLKNSLPEVDQIASDTPSPPPRKKRKTHTKRSEVNVEAIAVTFDLFLRSMRLVDTSLTVPLMRRVEELMTEMKEGVMGQFLDTGKKSKIANPSDGQVHVTLLLRNVWRDLHLLLSQHTNYRLTEDTSSDWPLLYDFSSEREDIMQLQLSLAVQQVRTLILQEDVESPDVQEKLSDIAVAVCHRVTSGRNSSSRNPLLPTLLENLPLLLPFFPSKQLGDLSRLLCETLSSQRSTGSLRDQQVVRDKPGGGDAELCRVCEEFAVSDFCVESRRLQTALVTSILGRLSEVMGSVSTLSVHRSILQNLSEEETCEDILNQTFQEIIIDCNQLLRGNVITKKGGHVGPKLIMSLEGTLKVIQFLPLHHLLPTNLARCMLGLLLVDLALIRTSPKKSPTNLAALLLCRRLEAAILKGTGKAEYVSSLDAVRILSVLMESFVDADNQMTQVSTPIADRNTSDLNDVTEELLTYWLKRVRQLPNQEAAFKGYCGMVESKLGELSRHLSHAESAHAILSTRLPLLTVSTTLLSTLLVIKGSFRSQTSELTDVRPILKMLHGIMEHIRSSSTCPTLFNHLVRVGTVLVKFALRFAKMNSEMTHLGDASRETTDSSDESDTMETTVSIATVSAEQWTNIFNPVLLEIRTYLGSPDEKSLSAIGSCLSFMQISLLFIGRHCDASTRGMGTGEMWMAMLSLMGTRDQWNADMMNDFQSTLSRIIDTMDPAQFKASLNDLLQDTSAIRKADTNNLYLRGALMAWQLLPGSVVSEESQDALADVISKVIFNLLRVLQDAVQDWTLGGAVVLFVLQAVKSIVERGKSLIPPDEAMQAQHFCLMIPVAKVTPAEFPLVFKTMCQILRSLLIGYPRTVMSSLASYMACLQSLLKAVMQKGQQTMDTSDRLSDHDLYMCAESMERLLTMLATYKDDVNKLAVFLVTDYIAELQKGTLLPLFKKTLVIGVYNLLDVSDERAIDFLNANLPVNLREIFKTFYSDFQKYYRYSGKV